MVYIFLGLLSFGFAALAEWAAVRGINRAAPVAWIFSAVCGIVSVVMVSIEGERIGFPTYVSILGWVGVMVFGGLFLYSALIELFLHGTPSEGEDTTLVTTGTYALTRHPAFLWLSLFLICLIFATRSRLLLVAAPLWILADGLYVWFEEKVYFDRMFDDYHEYKQHTPMLLPTLSSLRRFLTTRVTTNGV
jgi:protein-S-isoprenylcysteine O-methyltransferase Ste14